MVKRYYGGIMSANLISTSSTSASGFFGTHNQMQAKQSRNWPLDLGGILPSFFYLWGDNLIGQLGDNTIIHRSSPIQTISGGTNWANVSMGGDFVAAIKTDGTLWSWGRGVEGQLGNGGVSNFSSPVQTVAGGFNWSSVSSGSGFSAAIKTDGTLWTWGTNYRGLLGDNTTTSRSSPVQTVAGGTNWASVSAGKNAVAAIKTDGTLWAWGSNEFGQLGRNDIVHRSSPIQTVAGGSNWRNVSFTAIACAAIKTDGTLWAWGYNQAVAQLGDNTMIHRSSPVQTVAGGTNWSKVSGGGYHFAAIKTDGTLWTWGYNAYAQIGDNTLNTNRSSPVQTVASGSNWSDVTASYGNTAAIKTDGTLWVWGRNSLGQLGDNTIINRSSPIQTIAGGTNWVKAVGGVQNGSFLGGIKSS